MIGNIHNPQYSQWCLMKNYSDISYFVRPAEEGLVRPIELQTNIHEDDTKSITTLLEIQSLGKIIPEMITL